MGNLSGRQVVRRQGAEVHDIKCIAVGDGSIGKTSLLMTYTTGTFPTAYVPTVVDNYSKKLDIDGVTANLTLWDTAGQEDYDKLRPLSYPGAHVFLLTYSVVSPTSFENIKIKWFPEVAHYCPHVPFLLVGTKTDLKEDFSTLTQLKSKNLEPVNLQDAIYFSKEIGAYATLECSAVTKEGVMKVFEEAVRAVRKQKRNPRKTSF
eukprot:TRINITY_DN7508_c0_g1_i8.p1 TRINITY_DN7508_c0_g1~~TRINITY_DN7508_c0_g1_i8.p1  ORF type:complete len:205 (-),score=40.27 TRINITY_DN7508_c0_g1_i8:376-990(-)